MSSVYISLNLKPCLSCPSHIEQSLVFDYCTCDNMIVFLSSLIKHRIYNYNTHCSALNATIDFFIEGSRRSSSLSYAFSLQPPFAYILYSSSFFSPHANPTFLHHLSCVVVQNNNQPATTIQTNHQPTNQSGLCNDIDRRRTQKSDFVM